LGKHQPDFIRNESLPGLLSESFITHSGKTAFIFNEQQLSYTELDSWSNAIAGRLIAEGVKPGDPVGVWYPRSLELPVIILGIIKAGAAYV
ncbi:AMP-binding protein, partial [Staphylococcus aureus]|nr:AMP-binding protein [Staphylococcus aureus]